MTLLSTQITHILVNRLCTRLVLRIASRKTCSRCLHVLLYLISAAALLPRTPFSWAAPLCCPYATALHLAFPHLVLPAGAVRRLLVLSFAYSRTCFGRRCGELARLPTGRGAVCGVQRQRLHLHRLGLRGFGFRPEPCHYTASRRYRLPYSVCGSCDAQSQLTVLLVHRTGRVLIWKMVTGKMRSEACPAADFESNEARKYQMSAAADI